MGKKKLYVGDKLNLKAVIFDMDGVILDSEPIYYQIETKFFGNLGISISDEEYHTFVGLSMMEMCRRIKNNHNLKEEIETLVKSNNEVVFQHFSNSENLQSTPFLEQFMQNLLENNIKLAVASSSSKKLIEVILEKLILKKYFKICVSGNEVKNGKPAPDVFLYTANLMNVNPEECLVIEDSTNGVKAAKSAEMMCVGFQNSNSGNQDLSDADMIISTFSGLYEKIIKFL